MADKFCFQCDEKLGRLFKFGNSVILAGKKEPLKGMTKNDEICEKCYNNLPLNKEKAKEEEHDKEHKKKINEIRSHFQKGSMVYKDEYCAILKKIDDLTFVMHFRELTKEGYRMMAQDEGGQFHLGIASVGAGSYYFFQKIEYITRADS